MTVRLSSLADLAAKETSILATVDAVPHGSLLFITDPVRFLREQGYEVAETLREQLPERARGSAQTTAEYEQILAGTAEACQYDVRIRSLGIPKEVVR